MSSNESTDPPSASGMAQGEYAISSFLVNTVISVSLFLSLRLDASVKPAAPAPILLYA